MARLWFVKVMMSKRGAMASVMIGSLLVIFAIFADFLAPANPYKQDLKEALQPPSLQHLFGTDFLGRDVLSRIIYGSRTVIYVAALTMAVAMGIGVTMGLISGYYEGFFDHLIMRVTDVLLAFPTLIFAMALTSALGLGLQNAIIAVGVSSAAPFARLVRGQVLSTKQLLYVESARALGMSNTRIIFLHILPNIAGPIIVQASFSIAGAILSTAALSFLGLGAQPPTTSWGMMVSEGRYYLRVAPHLLLFPGLAISVVALAFNVIGEAFRDVLDPRSTDRMQFV